MPRCSMPTLFSENTGITIGFALTIIGIISTAIWKYSTDRATIEEKFGKMDGDIRTTGELAYMARQDVVVIRKEIEDLQQANNVTSQWMAKMEVKIDRLLEDVRTLISRKK